jgi:hypothetical protein
MDFQPIGEIVKSLLSKLDLEERAIEASVREWWVDLVGKEIARYSAVRSVRKGRLLVIVKGPVLIQELSQYRKKEILAELNRRIGNSYIKDVFFKVGEVKSGDEKNEKV